jgi:hypothetical protein
VSSHRLNPSKAGDWYVLIGRYDAEFVARLKEVVPHQHREWREVAKLWRVRPEYVEPVRELIGEFYGSEKAEG